MKNFRRNSVPHQMEWTDHDDALRPAEQGEVRGFERVQNRACDRVVWLSGYSHTPATHTECLGSI